MRQHRLGALVALLLASSGSLFAWGMSWGIPYDHSWAPDEILPRDVIAGAEQSFSSGWYSRYPPLHYYVLASVVAVGHGPIPSEPAARMQREGALLRQQRGVSVAMGMALVLVVFLIARPLTGPNGALVAAALTALSTPVVYYSKFANVDVPYTLWFAISLLFLSRILSSDRLIDWLGFSVTATLAVCTKDQAYALYLLAWPLLALLMARRRGQSATVALMERRLWLPIVVGALGFALLHNLAFNAAGFRSHVDAILEAGEGYRTFAPTLGGQLELAASTLRIFAWSLGAPAALLCAAGLGLALVRGDTRLLALLLPVVSYYVCFSSVVLYTYDRFLLPAIVVISIFGGHGFAEAAAPRFRWLAGATVVAALSYGTLRAVLLDASIAADSRYRVESWLAAEVAASDRVAMLGPLEYLPRPFGLDWKTRSELERSLLRMNPDVVVLNADYARRSEPWRSRRFYTSLMSGRLGYEAALRHRAPWRGPRWANPVAQARQHGLPTNLDKINPEIWVMRRGRSKHTAPPLK